MTFENVLIAEDHEVANLSLRLTLQDLHVARYDHAYYCDLALSMIRKAIQETRPYDLLVTDLYFEIDGTAKQRPDGYELILSARALQPALKVIVFSAESRTLVIRKLFDELGIDGFVRKARGDAQELKIAIKHISEHRKHYPREYRSQQDNLHDFTDYDKTIIKLIAGGRAQKEIPAFLEALQIKPSGLSSIEKRLNLIKTAMGFTNNEQLVVFCREMGLI